MAIGNEVSLFRVFGLLRVETIWNYIIIKMLRSVKYWCALSLPLDFFSSTFGSYEPLRRHGTWKISVHKDNLL
jgi:hypothetical protein